MFYDNFESSILQEAEQDYIDSPLWKSSTEEVKALKLGDKSALKRKLYSKNTFYGIGKLIEATVYPKNLTTLKVQGPIPSWVNELKTYLNLIEKDGVIEITPQLQDPELITLSLRTALFIYIENQKPSNLSKDLGISKKDLDQILENNAPISYILGLDIEALVNYENLK